MTMWWENWLLLALFTAGAWAVSCIVDVCLVGGRLFRRPIDAAAVSGLFCAVPLVVLAPAASVPVPPAATAAWLAAMLAGCAYLAHVYWYFRALFALNDASSAETFNSLCVLFVPLLAFLLLGERLPEHQYLSLALAIGGVLLLTCRQLAGAGPRAILPLSWSVISMSAAMVLQARAYRELDFATGTSAFLAAAFLSAAAASLVGAARRNRIVQLCQRLGPVFIAVELIELCAVLSSQRATEMAPSVSLVALVECALPLFVVGFSFLLLLLARRRLPSTVRASLTLQTVGWSTKLTSVCLIGAGILLSTRA